MRRTFIWAFAPYALFSAIHLILLAIQSPLAAPTKLALMPLLAIPVVVWSRRVPRRGVTVLLLAVILFSWLGDGAGAFFPDAPELPLMLAFFGIAHLAYITLFLRHLTERRMPWWTLVYAAWWIAMVALLGPHTGGLLVAVAAYGLVLGGTAALSARCSALIAAGGAFFLVSDTILAFRLFLPDVMPLWTSAAVMFTYTIGQGLIVAGALLQSRERVPR